MASRMGIVNTIRTILLALFGDRAHLLADNLALRHQLAVLRRSAKRPKLRKRDRIFWTWLSRLWPAWRSALLIVQPDTVARWHRQGFRLYWRWKSRRKLGRPKVERQVRDHLLLLRYDTPCEDTIRKYMAKPRNPRGNSTSWLPFLRNHLDVSWAMDFFTVTTIRFATLYVFLVLAHGRRRVVHFAITCSPSMGWVIQQLREAMPHGLQPQFVFRDNDGIYGNGVGEFLDSCGTEEVRTAYRCPWQNPFVERLVGTLRRELLDHMIVLGQGHLERMLREFIEEYYHPARPHQGLDGDTPIPQPKTDGPIIEPTKLISTPILGGLHHRY